MGEEVRALHELLRLSVGSLVVRIDNEAVVKDLNGDRRSVTSGRSAMAHLWRAIFANARVASDQVEVRWVKGHITQAMVDDGRWLPAEKIGNDAANAAAIKGAQQHTEYTPP